MTNLKGFRRDIDVSGVGIPNLSKEGRSLEDSLIQEEIDSINKGVLNISGSLEKENESELIRHILEGNIFEIYDFKDIKQIEVAISKALISLKKIKQADFISDFNGVGPIPLAEFEQMFRKRVQRILALYNYQKQQAEIEYFFQTYGTEENKRFIASKNFENNFLDSYALTISSSCFNSDGFSKLSDTFRFMEAIFFNGTFDEYGEALLKKSLDELTKITSKFNRSFSEEYSENYIDLVASFKELLEKISQNNWEYDKEDVENLRELYKIKETEDESFNLVCAQVKKAVREHRNPSSMAGGLLSQGDILQIIWAQNLIRNAFGSNGIILNSDLKKLSEISKYLQDVFSYKAGLLTVEQNETLLQIITKIEAITHPSLLIQTIEDPMKTRILEIEARKINDQKYKGFRSSIKNYHQVSSDKKASPTTILDPLILSAKQDEEDSKRVKIDENIFKETEFYKKIKYVSGSPNFDYLYAQAQNFLSKIDDLKLYEKREEMAQFLKELSAMKLPSISKLDAYLSNDLERLLLIMFAYEYKVSESEGADFKKDITKYFTRYKFIKEKLKKDIFRYVLFQSLMSKTFSGVRSLFEANKILINSYPELKEIVQANFSETSSQNIFSDFVIDLEALYIEYLLVKTGEQLFAINFFESLSLNPEENSFIDDLRKIIDKIIYFTSPKNLKPSYVLDNEQFEKIKKLVEFSFELQRFFPTFDSFYGKPMVLSALSKFNK